MDFADYHALFSNPFYQNNLLHLTSLSSLLRVRLKLLYSLWCLLPRKQPGPSIHIFFIHLCIQQPLLQFLLHLYVGQFLSVEPRNYEYFSFLKIYFPQWRILFSFRLFTLSHTIPRHATLPCHLPEHSYLHPNLFPLPLHSILWNILKAFTLFFFIFHTWRINTGNDMFSLLNFTFTRINNTFISTSSLTSTVTLNLFHRQPHNFPSGTVAS